MATEIERKFLVADLTQVLSATISSEKIAQGYLSRDPERTVRVRVRGNQGFITIKSKNNGATRGEWEYPVPEADARELLALCPPPIVSKVRHSVPYEGLIWEVDIFVSPRAGLIVAEVELPTEDYTLALPPWVGEEVTGNPAYYNSNL